MLFSFLSVGQEEEKYTVLVNLYQPISHSEKQLLEDILLSQIEFFISEKSYWEGNKINFSLTSKKMLSKIDDLVKNDIRFYDYKALEDFKGFSDTIKKKIENISSRAYDINPNAFLSEKQQKSNNLNHQFDELLMIMKTELYVFGEKDSVVNTSEVYPNLTLDEKEALIKQIEEFKEGDFLESIELSYKEIKAEDESGIFMGSSGKKDLADQILDLLAANSQRLERLESELVQHQIDGNPTYSGSYFEGEAEILSQLPESLAFYFNSGSIGLSTATLLQLNEIVEILAKAPSIKVVITGYADKVGSIQTNLALSKRRAQAIKTFMKDSGMSEERFIINYYGSSKSESYSNEDRRVEIKFFI